MLVLDAFKGHLTDSVKKQLRKMNTELVILNRMTSVLQPMDVSINRPFKDRLRQQYLTWISDPARELTETGKLKKRSSFRSRAVGVGCMESHPGEHIVRTFKKCCISNALDGSEDDILWEDDGKDREIVTG